MMNARVTESLGNIANASSTYTPETSNAVSRRSSSIHMHNRRTNPATSTKWPPDTAMRCMMPDWRN